ncbi:MAG TPA: hypothetical protein VMT55_02870, partial [Candidatus Sulfotelmatobacter sp.]|nr:hypothetical protein [Candidatus Sulfotelmatobacter sp.]
ITSVSEDYATAEAVNKYAGSFSLNLRPLRQLRLRYLYKPSFTVISRTNGISYNNEQQQAEVNLLPWNELALGLLYKIGHAFDIDKLDYPSYTIKQDTNDTDSLLYTLKMAPLSFMSTEFNYQLDNGRTTNLATAEPLSYIPGRSFSQKFDAVVRTSLSERLSFDSRYTYLRNTAGSLEAADDVANNVSHTASLKGNWNASDSWTFYLSAAYTRTTDNLSAAPLSYTLTPGTGFIYRAGDKLRVDFDASYSKSYAGVITELTDWSLKGKYSLSDFVNVVLRAERTVSTAPDYKLTDISGNVEINL